jgi:hypothetical protein
MKLKLKGRPRRWRKVESEVGTGTEFTNAKTKGKREKESGLRNGRGLREEDKLREQEEMSI